MDYLRIPTETMVETIAELISAGEPIETIVGTIESETLAKNLILNLGESIDITLDEINTRFTRGTELILAAYSQGCKDALIVYTAALKQTEQTDTQCSEFEKILQEVSGNDRGYLKLTNVPGEDSDDNDAADLFVKTLVDCMHDRAAEKTGYIADAYPGDVLAESFEEIMEELK